MGNGAKKMTAHLRACDSLLSQVLRPSASMNPEVGRRMNSIAGLAERPHYESQQPRRNVLIVGAGAFGRRIASSIQRHPEQGRVVCGFLDDRRPLGDE